MAKTRKINEVLTSKQEILNEIKEGYFTFKIADELKNDAQFAKECLQAAKYGGSEEWILNQFDNSIYHSRDLAVYIVPRKPELLERFDKTINTNILAFMLTDKNAIDVALKRKTLAPFIKNLGDANAVISEDFRACALLSKEQLDEIAKTPSRASTAIKKYEFLQEFKENPKIKLSMIKVNSYFKDEIFYNEMVEAVKRRIMDKFDVETLDLGPDDEVDPKIQKKIEKELTKATKAFSHLRSIAYSLDSIRSDRTEVKNMQDELTELMKNKKNKKSQQKTSESLGV